MGQRINIQSAIITKSSESARENIKKRRKKKNLRIILTALLVAAFVAALGAVLIWKVFVVKDVSVKGNEIYTDKQIEDWVLDEKYSWNSLYVYFENFLFPRNYNALKLYKISVLSKLLNI